MMASASVLAPTRAAGVEQAVQGDDEIAHMGVVDGVQTRLNVCDARPSLRELGLAVAQQIDERTMAGGTGGNQRAMHDMRSIVA
jgi:hypothetical protein